jgi:transcriptional regulator with XRE-family HTH domain
MDKSTHTTEYAALRSELRSVREAAELSQRELAARLKVPHSWIAKVENGERRIDLIEFFWFIAACGAEPSPIADKLFRLTRRKQKREVKKGAPSR